MEKVTALIYELFDALEGIESPLLVLEIILTAIMTRAIKKNNSASNTTPAAPSTDNITPAPAPEVPTTTVKDKKQAAKQLKNQLILDVDLLFSDKADEEMTEEENERCARVLRYIEELKK